MLYVVSFTAVIALWNRMVKLCIFVSFPSETSNFSRVWWKVVHFGGANSSQWNAKGVASLTAIGLPTALESQARLACFWLGTVLFRHS